MTAPKDEMMSEFKEGIHYEARGNNKGSIDYVCLSCGKYFPETYYPKSYQRPGKRYGTKQLMGLWAWYNFKRHLIKCFKPVKAKNQKIKF